MAGFGCCDGAMEGGEGIRCSYVEKQEVVGGCWGWGKDLERFEWVAAHDVMDGTSPKN